MSFWMGMARAYQDADTKKTEDRRINEEREFLTEQKAQDRKWEEDFFFRKLRAETDAERQNLLLRGGGGSRSGGSGGGGDDDSTVSLEALVRAHPELDPALVAKLAPYPESIQSVFDSLNSKKEEWANGRQAWTPELSNGFIRDVIPDEDEELTPERVDEIARMYGVDPAAEVVTGGGTTWGDMIVQQERGNRSATVLTDPTVAPEPMKPEQQRLFSEQVNSRLKGYLTTQLNQLNAEFANSTDPTRRGEMETDDDGIRLREEISGIQALIDQIDDGYTDEALNSAYGTQVMMDMYNAGNTFEYQRLFPQFKPHFASAEEAKAALASGFVKPGQTLMVLVDGTYKQARF